MNYGRYLAASGGLTNSYRQDGFDNNLANVNSVGFKPEMPVLTVREPEASEDASTYGTANALLDRLGGGVLDGRVRVDRSGSRTAAPGASVGDQGPEARRGREPVE